MSTAILEQATTPGRRQPAAVTAELTPDWEMASGPTQVSVQARTAPPKFEYRGYGDAHWAGQSCYLVGSNAAQPEHLTVIMACGCQASVPWWTLEPISPR